MSTMHSTDCISPSSLLITASPSAAPCPPQEFLQPLEQSAAAVRMLEPAEAQLDFLHGAIINPAGNRPCSLRSGMDIGPSSRSIYVAAFVATALLPTLMPPTEPTVCLAPHSRSQ